ncbi:MAG: hypothetical protein ACE5GT_00185 [Rhodospirillales bacterium]
MTEHAKIFPAAKKFVERVGQEAPTEASRRAAELRDVGNADGAATWEMIYQEVKALVEGDTNGTSQ